ncbi:hypothetical protein MNB_SV-13-127 [hydrothermal vent metagenome]|uniref:Uncharacterized protein n=1 Tax=hydrothermal vent metagenome TaxID=652676 RepID=A0A1W1CYG4_9ZZZZ
MQQTLNVKAETALRGSQKGKNVADTGLINEQKGLVTNQKATELKVALTEAQKASNQITGFDKDMRYKILKSLSETSGMLAQNDVVTPSWMTTEMKNAVTNMKS